MHDDRKELPKNPLFWETSFPVELGNPYAAPPPLEEERERWRPNPLVRAALEFVYGVIAFALIWGFLLYALMMLAELSSWR